MPRTRRQIEADMVNSAINRGVASYIGEGSVMRELLGIEAYQLAELESKVEQAERNSHLSESTGSFLDRWGADLGLTRLESRRAHSRVYDLSCRFYTADGSLFNTLSGGSPVISVGDRIQNTDGTQTYIVTEIPSGYETQSQAYVGIQAVEDGTKGNLKPRNLSRHFLSGYEGSVLVENRYGIYNGTNRESDSAYLLRLKQRQLELESCNETAISNKILRVAGVGKYRIIFNYGGAGNVGVIVQPALGILNTSSFLEGLRKNVEDYVPAGTNITVKNPELRYLSLETTLGLSEILNTTQKQVLINRITSKLLSYFNGLTIGDSLNLTSIENVIKTTDSRISRLGDNPKYLNTVNLSIKDGASTYTETINTRTRTVGLDIDELLVLDDTTPIVINII